MMGTAGKQEEAQVTAWALYVSRGVVNGHVSA